MLTEANLEELEKKYRENARSFTPLSTMGIKYAAAAMVIKDLRSVMRKERLASNRKEELPTV